MSITLPVGSLVPDTAATSSLFGGNVLATRSSMTGEGSYDEAVDGLNVAGLRYPGGSLTEYCFDISDPDAAEAIDDRTGEATDFIPLSEFMSYAGMNGHAVTIVLPTRTQFGTQTDANGNRSPEVDEGTLRDFVHDLMTGEYGDAQVRALEIGNEYWGSGECSAVEYGRLAAEMSRIVRDELDLVERLHGIDTSQTKLLVQMGSNHGSSCLSDAYGGQDGAQAIADLMARFPSSDISENCLYASGDVNWTQANDALIRMSFDTTESRDAIDGVVAHVYSQGTTFSRQFALDCIRSGWLEQEGFEDLEIHVTEWNQRMGEQPDGTEPGGLVQAQEMLELVEEFMSSGVEQAHVWPLIQNTTNALASGFDYDAPSVAGEMFSMMSRHLPGKSLVDMVANDPDETEFSAGEADIHAFAGDGDMLLYVLSKADTPVSMDIDLSAFLAAAGRVEISVLGRSPDAEGAERALHVAQGRDQPPGPSHDMTVECDLAADEIMQVVIHDIVPTEKFAAVLGALASGDVSSETVSPDGFEVDDASSTDGIEQLAPPEETEASEDGSWAGLSAALALLPLLALFGV